MIHPTALVASSARIDSNVDIGPFALIGPEVEIGAKCIIHGYTHITGRTVLGKANTIHSHCVIGGPPQDKKYAGEHTRLLIGEGNTIREYCTINTGTVQDNGVTKIGDNNWIMAYVHIAHDCEIGSHVIMANGVQLAGHVSVDNWATLGGCTVIHQFTKIGLHALTSMGTILLKDLPPYVIAAGNPAAAYGVNVRGLKRHGWSSEQIAVARRAYRLVYRSGLGLSESISELNDVLKISASEKNTSKVLVPMIRFLSCSERGIVR